MAWAQSVPDAQSWAGTKAKFFGQLSLVRDGRQHPWTSVKEAEVLAFLVAHSGKGVRRSELLDLFWPDFEATRARLCLRQVLFQVRRQLQSTATEDQPIVSEGDFLRVIPGGLESDVSNFETSVAGARHSERLEERTRLLSLASSEFSGSFLVDSDSPWSLMQRFRYDSMFASATGELVDCLCLQNRPSEAVTLAQRATLLLPMRQDLHAHLIKAHLAAGEVNDAIQAYDVLERILRDELGEEPSNSVKQLLADRRPAEPALAEAWTALKAEPDYVSVPMPFCLGTPFVGRDEVCQELEDLLLAPLSERPRLVSIVGPPGVGKSRVGAETVNRMDWRNRQFWWFRLPHDGHVDLWDRWASLVDRSPDRSREQLLAIVGDSDAVLLLDDCDQHRATVAQFVSEVNELLPNVTVIVTCCSALDLAQEAVHAVPPLAQGSEGEKGDDVELFELTARRAQRSFSLSGANLNLAKAICSELNGLPLAIILAAGRIRLHTLADLRTMASEDLHFLRRGSSPSNPKQDSFASTLDWSYDALTGDERTFLGKLALFDGEFSLATLRRWLESSDVEGLLDSLVKSNWVETGETRGTMRFRLLKPLRLYLASKTSDIDGSLSASLVACYDQWLVESSEVLEQTQDAGLIDRFQAELDTVYKLLLNDPDIARRHRVLGNLRPVFECRGVSPQWLAAALESLKFTSPDPETFCRALYATSVIAFFRRDFPLMASTIRGSLDSVDMANVRTSTWAALENTLAVAFRAMGKAEVAVEKLERVVQHGIGECSPVLQAKIHYNLGCALESTGDTQRAVASFRQGRDIASKSGLSRMYAICQMAVSRPRDLRPPLRDDIDHLGAALSALEELGDRRAAAYVSSNLGLSLVLYHDFATGLPHLLNATEFDAEDHEWASLRSDCLILSWAMKLLREFSLSDDAFEIASTANSLTLQPLESYESELLEKLGRRLSSSPTCDEDWSITKVKSLSTGIRAMFGSTVKNANQSQFMLSSG